MATLLATITHYNDEVS